MIEFDKEIGPVTVSILLSRTTGRITLGNNPYAIGVKFGILWRMPRLHIGGFTNPQYGWKHPYMSPHKYNIRIGS